MVLIIFSMTVDKSIQSLCNYVWNLIFHISLQNCNLLRETLFEVIWILSWLGLMSCLPCQHLESFGGEQSHNIVSTSARNLLDKQLSHLLKRLSELRWKTAIMLLRLLLLDSAFKSLHLVAQLFAIFGLDFAFALLKFLFLLVDFGLIVTNVVVWVDSLSSASLADCSRLCTFLLDFNICNCLLLSHFPSLLRHLRHTLVSNLFLWGALLLSFSFKIVVVFSLIGACCTATANHFYLIIHAVLIGGW